MWSARAVTRPLAAIRTQVKCFTSNDISECPLQAGGGMAETEALSDDIMALRHYMNEVMVRREDVLNLKRWHWEILSGLLKQLQHRLSGDSPLLESMNDYAVLLQTERGDVLPRARSFDLAHTLHASLAGARKLIKPAAQVNVTASLQADLPRLWTGQPELLEALFRHLLVIGLKRTRAGFVCLRVHAPTSSSERLYVTFEDSGPAIPTWQLRQWLAPAKEETPPVSMDEEISWLLVARLFRRLGGDISGTSFEGGGLSLEGSLTMTAEESPPVHKSASLIPMTVHDAQPAVLLVEGESRRRLAPQFEAARYRVLTAASHAQMVEWSGVLPISALILNFAFADDGQDALRKLTHMREEGVLGDIPFWAIADVDSLNSLNDRLRQAIAEPLMLPLKPELLRRLSAELKTDPRRFYWAHDVQLRQEFSEAVKKSLPQMDALLGLQIAELLPLIDALARGERAGDLLHGAHAVKSAALNLGYFRLAGLMGQIEHASKRRDALPAHNWALIAGILRESGFMDAAGDQNPAQRGATSS